MPTQNNDTLDTLGDVIIYQSEDGETKIDVHFIDDTVWLSQVQMAELFQTSRTNVVEHIKHIYEEGELEQEANLSEFPTGSPRRATTSHPRAAIL